MAASELTDGARRENSLTLAETIGVSLEAAAELLDAEVIVTAPSEDRIASAIADDVVTLLARTLETVRRRNSSVTGSQADAADRGSVMAEVVIGDGVPTTTAPIIRVGVTRDQITCYRIPVGHDAGAGEPCENIPVLLGRLSACYIAAAVMQVVLGPKAFVETPNPFVLRFAELGVTVDQLKSPVDIGHAYLAGAGAIGNGFLWAAECVDIHGTLDIVDDDVVGDRNLNRQLLFKREDVSFPKAARLAMRAAPLVPGLTLRSRSVRVQELDEREGPWLRTLIVAVDSRRARRALQNELPGEVFDASTTDVREVVVHHHKQPTSSACLACIYRPDEEESTREKHIAEALGVPLDHVRMERISEESAVAISMKYPHLSKDDLVGTAYDTLFKQLCGTGQLQSESDKRILAPFAFVSCLASILLLIEIIRHRSPGANPPVENYWRISAWHPPLSRRRTLQPRESSCESCANPVLNAVSEQLWGSPRETAR